MEYAFMKSLSAELLPLADPQRAVHMKAYMRNQFDFLGIQTPLRRQATQTLVSSCSAATSIELIKIAARLWKQPYREFHYVAVDLLIKQNKNLSCSEINAILSLVQEHSWWDTVDGLANVVGRIIKSARMHTPSVQRQMDVALHHPNVWVRRTAMLHQLGWKEETDTERLFAYARELAGERDFFIRKAIGWALRDYARSAPDTVRHFLKTSSHLLSALSIREAGKHLSGTPSA